MQPLQPKQQTVPLPSAPASRVRPSSLVQAAWCVRMHPMLLRTGWIAECLTADLALCCWIDLERAEEGESAAVARFAWSEAARFKCGRLLRQPSCSTPALPSISSSHCARGRVAADGPWGWENHGLSASQAEFRTMLRTDKKPRTEPKLAPLRQPAKERPSSHKITGHIRQDLGRLQAAAAWLA
jgi:hypothetical protein